MKATISILVFLVLSIQLIAQQDDLIALQDSHVSLPTSESEEATSPSILFAQEANCWLSHFRRFAAPYYIKPNSIMAILGDEGIVIESEEAHILKLVLPLEEGELPDLFSWKNDTWLLKSNEDLTHGTVKFRGVLGGMPVCATCRMVTWQGEPSILFTFEHRKL